MFIIVIRFHLLKLTLKRYSKIKLYVKELVNELNLLNTNVANEQTERVYFLDSLRGIAASTVIFTHLADIYMTSNLFLDICRTLGRCAVILFFILSGIVLSASLNKFKNLTGYVYISFFIKRICRIYLPFIIIIVLSYEMFRLMNFSYISSLSDWFNVVGTNLTSSDLISNLFMTGTRVDRINPVIWSLIVELRISIIFPFLYFIFRENSRKNILGFAGLCFVIGTCFLYFIGNEFLIGQTVFHCGFFMFGLYLFIYKPKLLLKSNVQQTIILTISIFLYFNLILFNLLHLPSIRVFSDFCSGLGAAGIIYSAFRSSVIQKELLKPMYHTLGVYSFSIYLVHCIAFIPMIHMLTAYNLSYVRIELMSLPVIAIVSYISYHLIEKPTIFLGRYLSESALKILNNQSV